MNINRPKILQKTLSMIVNKRINRGNALNQKPAASTSGFLIRPWTVMLESLQCTVRRDTSVVKYRYHDDPYLMPCSNLRKSSFAISQEAGRKAANWTCEANQHHFKSLQADPSIYKFNTITEFTSHININEHCLELLIRKYDVINAVSVYKHLLSEHLPIADSVKKSLLLLVCTFDESKSSHYYIEEERCFGQSIALRSQQWKFWENVELAESLFSELALDAQTYGAIIRGMCQHGQFSRALTLFQDALDSEFELDAETFNAIISAVIFVEAVESRWKFCLKILNIMNTKKIRPNLSTMNSLLCVISHSGNLRTVKDISLKVLGEFNSISIEPSLATYYYLLVVFCRRAGPISYVLHDVLSILEETEFLAKHIKDTYFFVTAMDIARYHLRDKDIAYRIEKLLNYGNNYELIGDSYKESICYRHFLAIQCEAEPLADFMEKYASLVPSVYTPEPGIMETILKAVKRNSAHIYLPKLWADMKAFDHVKRSSLLHLVLQIITDKPSIELDASKRHLNECFNVIAWDIFKRLQEQCQEQSNKISGSILGSILQILSLGNDSNKAKLVFENLKQHQHSGSPSIHDIMTYVDLCIAHNSLNDALTAMKLSDQNGMNSSEMRIKIERALSTNVSDREL